MALAVTIAAGPLLEAQGALRAEPHSACLLDARFRIVAVNAAWDAFAAAGQGAG